MENLNTTTKFYKVEKEVKDHLLPEIICPDSLV